MNADQSAYPQVPYRTVDGSTVTIDAYMSGFSGLTKREEFAKVILAGMLASDVSPGDVWDYAREAVKYADALLAELAKEKKP
jgi:hypothetical protein